MAQRYFKGKGIEQLSSSDSEDDEHTQHEHHVDSNQADSNQADDHQADSNHVDSNQADSNQADDHQADSSQVDDMAHRRRLMRERALANRMQPEDPASSEQNEEDDEESQEEEDEESEQEDLQPRILLKPVFVSKTKRETVIERQDQLAKTREQSLVNEQKAQEKKAESSEMVMEALRKEMEEIDQKVEDLMVDDTDNLNPEEEEEAWKLRELERILRNKKTKEKRIQEQIEIERRRNMTDAQVEEENNSNVTEKQKYNFLQKYYHKGAFAVDERVEEIMKRTNANAPTLEDKFDKSVLPEVLQVKKFGLKGRTKYTHLTDQDTTEVLSADIVWP